VRLTAFDEDGAAVMAVVLDDVLEPLCPVAEFYADVERWMDAAASVTSGSVARVDRQEVPAVPPTAKVLCVGLNYQAHAAEGGRDVPPHPNVFARWASTLVADGATIPLPVEEPRLDYEAELVAVIGAELSGADPAVAAAGILGYACGNDVTARGYQHRTSQWGLGKNADRSAPIGPLVTPDELGPLDDLAIVCRLNGTEVQRSRLGRMIFPPDEIISYASGCLTLHPGDVIYTGTPEGVGFRRDPPLFMGDGDVVEVAIEGIGSLSNRIVSRMSGVA
jgi:2,4-diketo-3-deoxy-L-fuconate hydrolase